MEQSLVRWREQAGGHDLALGGIIGCHYEERGIPVKKKMSRGGGRGRG